jgi:aerobic carbon-monoxide dehydrogenase medium subunit
MFPARFEYFRANRLTEAVDLLARYGRDGRILAGGQSLIPLMKLRLASPKVLIDINRIQELEIIEEHRHARNVSFGPLVRHRHLEVVKWASSLASIGDAAKVIGDPQIRNVGTIGGSLAEVDPAGDWGPVMLSLGASIKAISTKGERAIPIDDFFVEAYTSALREDELIKEIEIPLGSSRTGSAYLKMERKAGDFAIASAAVRVSLDAQGHCESVKVGVGGVGLVPFRVRGAEEHLEGKRLDQQLMKDAARLVAENCEPFADIRGTVEFKRHLAGVLFRRALMMAADRAQGKEVEAIHV